MLELIKKLVHDACASGYGKGLSSEAARILAEYSEEISLDNAGNIIASIHGSGHNCGNKKILMAAHMDSPGFITTSALDSGYIKIAPLGHTNMVSAAYTDVTSSSGVRGFIIPELSNKADGSHDASCMIDIGASSQKAAERLVKTGDVFIPSPKVSKFRGKLVSGRPLDGAAVSSAVIKAAMKLKTDRTYNDIYIALIADGQQGFRSAGCAAAGVNPDIAVVISAAQASSSCKGTSDGATPISLEQGAAIRISDNSFSSSEYLTILLRRLAEENKILHQAAVLTTDKSAGSVIQKEGRGYPTADISIPVKYLHTACEIISLKDVEACSALAEAFCRCAQV